MASPFSPFIRELGFEPTPGQRAFIRVAYDGEEPRDLGHDREMAAKIFGDVDAVPPLARSVVVMTKGRDVGGTRLSTLRGVHLMLTINLLSLAPNELAYAAQIAPDKPTARHALRFARGAVGSRPELEQLIESESANGFMLRRPDGRLVAFEVFALSRGGSSLRGRPMVYVGMTESSHMLGDDFVFSADDAFRAVRPRLLPGGQIVLESTPWIQDGLHWKLHTANFGAPSTALVAKCPTELMRNDPQTRAMVAAERERSPDNALVEFDAEFMSADASAFFDGPSLAHAQQLPSFYDQIKMREPPGLKLYAGCDFGFRRDASALCVVARYGGKFEVVFWDVLKPRKGQALVPSETCSRFADSLRRHGLRKITADLFYAEAVKEHFKKERIRLELAPTGQRNKAEQHMAVRDALRESKVRIPPNATELVRQLQAITARPVSGGGLSISSPRTRGQGHGDLASAAILAIWDAMHGSSVGPLEGYL